MYPEHAKGGDILSFDIYPVNGGVGLEAVPKGVDNLRKWSNYEKPVVAILEGSNIDDTSRATVCTATRSRPEALLTRIVAMRCRLRRARPQLNAACRAARGCGRRRARSGVA